MKSSNETYDSGEGGLCSVTKQVELIGFSSSGSNVSGDGSQYSESEGLSLHSLFTSCWQGPMDLVSTVSDHDMPESP